MGKTDFFRKLQEKADTTDMVVSTNEFDFKLGQEYQVDKVLVPRNIDQLQMIVKLANEHRVSLYPIGSGSRFHQGVAPFDNGILVSMKKINKLVEYRPNNMSIEIEAGMTFSQVQEILAPDNIFFPIDVYPKSSTIGGIIAANVFGRKKYMHKTTRFYVMGMEYISPQGEIITVGGKTIKNVSSYDLHQLLTGSWGTLGIITKATLRVKPIPEANRILEYSSSDFNELMKTIDGVLFKEKTNLASLVFEPLGTGYSIQVELEGFSDTLKLQEDLLGNQYGFCESQKEVNRTVNANARVTFPLKNYTNGLKQLFELGKLQPEMKIGGNATSGLVYLKINAKDDILEKIIDIIDTLQGNFVFEGKRLATKNRGAGYNMLLKTIKDKIDPNNILVPTSRVIEE